jgi:hypothetical protein
MNDRHSRPAGSAPLRAARLERPPDQEPGPLPDYLCPHCTEM